MQIVSGAIGLALAALSILHINMPDCVDLTIAYGAGSVLAFLTLVPNMSIPVARTFAVLATPIELASFSNSDSQLSKFF